jgi:hypothetical protein
LRSGGRGPALAAHGPLAARVGRGTPAPPVAAAMSARGFLTLAGFTPVVAAGVLVLPGAARRSDDFAYRGGLTSYLVRGTSYQQHSYSCSPAAAAAAAAAAGGVGARGSAGGGHGQHPLFSAAPPAAVKMTNRMRLAWDKRKRRWNAISPLHAFVYFREPAAAAAATAEALRMLGIVINKQASRTEPAADKRTLYVGNLARGQTPYAVALTLTLMLDSLGYQVALADAARLRHGMLCNGEAFIEFPSHAEAVAAAHWLQDAGTRRGGGGGRAGARGKLVVGFATEDERRRAAPKPVYF